MSISHNPIFNQAMNTATQAARQDQTEIDAQFAKITSSQKMTIEGTAAKVVGMFVVLLATAGVTWYFQLTALIFPALIVGLGLGLWATFAKKVRPAVIIAYAAAEGVFLGGLTLIFETMYPGIAQQAVLATLTTAGAMFAAYRFGWVKVNARFTRVMSFALIGYMGFAVINLLVGLFTGSAGVYSTGFGWMIALVGVGLAAFTLNLDFEAIVVGERQGLPVETEWRAAFGLVSSLVWLYVEILRLLAIFNRD